MLQKTHNNMIQNTGTVLNPHGYILSWECTSYNAISQTIVWTLQVTSTTLNKWEGTLYINNVATQSFSGSNTYSGTVTLTKANNNYGILNLKVVASKPYSSFERIYEDRVLIGGEFEVTVGTWGAYGQTASYGNTFTWTRTSFTEGNSPTTTISWSITAWGTTMSSNYTTINDLYINGVKVGDKNTRSGTYTIKHGADGSGSFTVKLADKSTTIIVAPLRYAATLTQAPNFNDEANPTISFSNPSGSLVDLLEACISFDGTKDDVPYRAITKATSGNYIFPLTSTERATLRKGIKTGTSTTVRFYLRTTIDGTYYYSSLTRTLTLVNYTPTLSPSVVDINARTVELTGDEHTFIKYFSNASFDTGAFARKEATIDNQYIICGTTTLEDYTSNTGVIEGIDSNTFYFSVTDSRGYTTRDALVVNLIPYKKLTAALTLQPLTLSGDLTFIVEGTFFTDNFGASYNQIEVEYGIRENGGDISWHIITLDEDIIQIADHRYVCTYTISGLNPKSTYSLTVNVIDSLMNVQTTIDSIISAPIFDWGKTDFKHNTPVYLTKNLSLRTIDNKGNDISVLNPCNPEGALILGWGQYEEASGDTSVYGNNINLTAKESVKINGTPIGGTVLWEGAYYMNASQVAQLSAPISEQVNGIVLVFSLYTDGSEEDVSINTFFVSKKEVELLPNAPHTFFMMINSGFSVMGAKYLYINDTAITGHATNSVAGTNNNMTYSNNRFVLRYVIGV